jgi:hypothetical protein
MTTNKRMKLIPAIARLDKPRKPTKQQQLRQHRQIKAWRKAGEANHDRPKRG